MNYLARGSRITPNKPNYNTHLQCSRAASMVRATISLPLHNQNEQSIKQWMTTGQKKPITKTAHDNIIKATTPTTKEELASVSGLKSRANILATSIEISIRITIVIIIIVLLFLSYNCQHCHCPSPSSAPTTTSNNNSNNKKTTTTATTTKIKLKI